MRPAEFRQAAGDALSGRYDDAGAGLHATGIELERLLNAADLVEHLVGHPLRARISRALLATACPTPSAAVGGDRLAG
ncbi:MAG: hypothetical protein M3Q65_24675 [Chloroflexota bacterium]|nr:hypothetical protein [Chloroflexota bacterium]